MEELLNALPVNTAAGLQGPAQTPQALAKAPGRGPPCNAWRAPQSAAERDRRPCREAPLNGHRICTAPQPGRGFRFYPHRSSWRGSAGDCERGSQSAPPRPAESRKAVTYRAVTPLTHRLLTRRPVRGVFQGVNAREASRSVAGYSLALRRHQNGPSISRPPNFGVCADGISSSPVGRYPKTMNAAKYAALKEHMSYGGEEPKA